MNNEDDELNRASEEENQEVGTDIGQCTRMPSIVTDLNELVAQSGQKPKLHSSQVASRHHETLRCPGTRQQP